MKEILSAAFPWIMMGLCLAAFFAHAGREQARSEEETSEKHGDYLIEGMCLGMSLGALISFLDLTSAGVGICCGMFFGEVAGLLIPKRGKKGGPGQ